MRSLRRQDIPVWTFTNERPVVLRISRGGQSRPHRRVLVDADSGSGCGRSPLAQGDSTQRLPEKITVDQSEQYRNDLSA